MSNKGISQYSKYLVVVVSVVVGLISVGVTIPMVGQIFSIRNQITIAESTRDKYDVKLNVLSNQNLPQLQNDLTNSLLALPSKYDSPSILYSLEKIAIASGLSFNGLQFSENVKKGSNSTAAVQSNVLLETNFALTATTDFAHIIAMLKNFENTLPLFVLKNLTVRSGGEIPDEITATFNVVSYYKSLPESLGDTTAVVSDLTENDYSTLQEIEGYSNYPLVPDTSGVGKTNPFN